MRLYLKLTTLWNLAATNLETSVFRKVAINKCYEWGFSGQDNFLGIGKPTSSNIFDVECGYV